ncbi:hypothetical protein IG631_23947 [Alternaria alternata]|nr:hypothetical protein IG631_23947 [Alternaria alternata]
MSVPACKRFLAHNAEDLGMLVLQEWRWVTPLARETMCMMEMWAGLFLSLLSSRMHRI